MIKKIFCFILSFVMTINLTACSKGKMEEEYIDKKWLFYDEITAEHLWLFFGSDGTFSYSCECGEPVGDSDLYERYKYDSENGNITLSNSYDDATSEIEVIDCNEYHLMVKIDGKIRDFILEEMDTNSNFYAFEGEKYLTDYDSRCTVVDIKEDCIIYGPVNYDPEGAYKDGPFEQYVLAENVSIFELTIQSYLSIQDEQEYEEFYEVQYSELTQEEMWFILDGGTGTAFVWFDDEMKVEKIVFWGQLSVANGV